MRAGPALVVAAVLALPSHSAFEAEALAGGSERIQLKVDTSEGEGVLAVLDAKKTGESSPEAGWQRIFPASRTCG